MKIIKIRVFNFIQNLINDETLALPASVKQTIQQFIDAIENRTAWTGSLSFGYKYNSNINQVPDKNKVWETPGTWKMANPKSSPGLTYDASLSKIIPISSNHSLQIKGHILWRPVSSLCRVQ
ncbi:DUF560 domain-containing protein [Providencia rettgeri]|nr:DUF560 domain-containing protein [Providencia rettgeri]